MSSEAKLFQLIEQRVPSLECFLPGKVRIQHFSRPNAHFCDGAGFARQTQQRANKRTCVTWLDDHATAVFLHELCEFAVPISNHYHGLAGCRDAVELAGND